MDWRRRTTPYIATTSQKMMLLSREWQTTGEEKVDIPDQVLGRDSWSTYTSPKDGRASDEDTPGCKSTIMRRSLERHGFTIQHLRRSSQCKVRFR